MARKVFISILGTNAYLEARYFIGEKPKGNEKTCRFVQEATMRHLCKDWGETDAAYIFVTDEAKSKNWNDPAQKDNKRSEKYTGLSKVIENMNFRFETKPVDIPEGLSEAEIWEIFEIVFEKLRDGDELYFDITHSFRSIPMLVMVLINYAKFLKNIKVQKIYYGAFEKLRTSGKAEEIPVNKRFVPILNITAFSYLQDWTFAAISFTKFGRMGEVIQLLHERNKNVELYDFSKDIISNRGLDILSAQKIIELKKQMINYNANIAPFDEIKSVVTKKLKDYKQNNTMNGFVAVDFCIENGLIQQGITLLQEFIVTKVMNDIGIKKIDEIRSNNNRHVITATLQRKNISKVNVELFLTNNDKKSKTMSEKKIKKYTNWVKAIFDIPYKNDLTNDIFKELSSNIRNDINHAGFRAEPLNAKDFEIFLKEKQKKTKLLFNINL